MIEAVRRLLCQLRTLLALAIFAGPVVLNGCLIDCSTRPGLPAPLAGHCHLSRVSGTVPIVSGFCGHDHHTASAIVPSTPHSVVLGVPVWDGGSALADAPRVAPTSCAGSPPGRDAPPGFTQPIRV